MKDVRVTYSVEATINTGNFENVKPGFTVSATVEENEKPGEVKAKLVSVADKWLDIEIARVGDGTK